MANRSRISIWATVLAIALVAAACSSEPTAEIDDPLDGQTQEDGGTGDDGSAGDDGATNGGVDAPVIDPSSMPPAGEAHVEVDGQTFVFKQSEMLEGPFACEVRDDGITINFQSDRHDLLLQGANLDGQITANATVAPEEGDFRYGASTGGGMGAVATDGSYVLFVGRFDSVPKDNPADFNDVGQGQIAVTCP